MTTKNGVGSALRSARNARQMSLSDVAREAGVSVATLSRVETEKQSIDVSLLIKLSEIVGITAGAILDGNRHSHDERGTILIRATKQTHRPNRSRNALNAQIDHLLAALDRMVEEIADLRRQWRRRS